MAFPSFGGGRGLFAAVRKKTSKAFSTTLITAIAAASSLHAHAH
jgi:hypothetical protein